MIALIIIIVVVIIIAVAIILSMHDKKKKKSTSKKPMPQGVSERNVSIDPMTPDDAINKYKSVGKDLIYSNEMKDINTIQNEWYFADEPLGTLGIADNFSYTPNNVNVGPEGLELEIKLNDNWSNCFQNGKFLGDQSDAILGKATTSGKVTGIKGVRFKYGTIEAKIKCPALQGVWPAFWLNFSSGTFGTKYVNNDPTQTPLGTEWKSLFLDYPFINSNFWPPEIDILEIVQDNYNSIMNQSSVHTPNQVVGGSSDYEDFPYRWCPNGLDNGIDSVTFNVTPRQHDNGAYCFGVSKFASYKAPNGILSNSHEWHVYRADWSPDRVDFYLDDNFYGSITNRDLVATKSGALRTVNIPSVPMFPIINLALSQSWTQAWPVANDHSFANTINFHGGQNMDPKSLISSPMQIAYVRIYQDQNGSGINPDLTPEDVQTIFTNQCVGHEFVPWYGDEINAYTEPQLDKIFDYLNNYLQSQYQDNYCINVYPASLWNYGGTLNFAPGASPTHDAKAYIINSILYYIVTRYGKGIKFSPTVTDTHLDPLVPTIKDEPTLKLPDQILNSPFIQNYGWPNRPYNTPAPCVGVQTPWATRLDNLKCV